MGGEADMDIEKIKAEADLYKQVIEDFKDKLEKVNSLYQVYTKRLQEEKFKAAEQFKNQFAEYFRMHGFTVTDSQYEADAKYQYKVISLRFDTKAQIINLTGIEDNDAEVTIEIEIEADNPHVPYWEIQIDDDSVFLGEEDFSSSLKAKCMAGSKYDINKTKNAASQLQKNILFLEYEVKSLSQCKFRFFVSNNTEIDGRHFKEIADQL